MARAKTPDEMLARAITYAAIHGDDAAAKKYKISTRTLQRARAAPSEQLSPIVAIVAEQKAELLEKWTDSIPSALLECVAFVRKATNELDASDPQALHAIAGAIKLLSEAQMNREVLDVWIENNRASTADFASPLERGIDERQALTN